MKTKIALPTILAISILFIALVAVAMNMASNNTVKDVVIPEGSRKSRDIVVGHLHFRVPRFFISRGGIRADGTGFDGAEFRNIYYGRCLQRVDGRCGSPYYDDKESSDFMVNLRVPEPNEDMHRFIEERNKKFANDCETPEEIIIKYKLEPDSGSAKWGMFCPYWFNYEGIIAKMRFRTGNFSRFDIPRMQAEVIEFLNTYRIHSSQR